jgi:hypothetical protein
VEAPRFCLWPMYTDPVAFCKNIEKQVVQLSATPITQSLLQAMHDFYEAMQTCVVARCGGWKTQGKAYGCAIYLPACGGGIDNSYYATDFAQNLQWIKLLEQAN